MKCVIFAIVMLVGGCGTMPASGPESAALEGSASRWACSWSQVGGETGDTFYCEAGPRLFTCATFGDRVTWSYYVDGYAVDSAELDTLTQCIERAEFGAGAGAP